VQSSPWFAIFTQPKHEKRVVQHFYSRRVDAFLPTYSSKRTWSNRQTVTLEVPLFPGYLFARISRLQRASVLGAPGVACIVGTPGSWGAVPEEYIETLRTGLALHRILPHPMTEVGDRVRIVAGPMAGIEGILAHVRSEFRVVLSIATIHQSVSIEVSRDEIEPLDANAFAGGFGPRAEC
jgi:transcription antitermination factor NusG